MKKIVKLTERDLSRIVRRVISENKEMSKEDIERELTSMAKFEFNIFKNYGDSDRPKYKKMFDERNDENTIYVNLNKHFMKGDDFYKFIEPVKKYLKDNDNKASLGKYNFKLDGNEIKITKEDNISEQRLKHILKKVILEMDEEKKEFPSSYRDLYGQLPEDLKKLLFKQWEAKQNPKWHPEGNSLKHILVVIKRAYHHYPDDPNMIMTALFHDLGKMDTYGINPKTGEPTAYGHEDKSEKYVEEYRDWIESYEGTDVDEIKYLVKNHMKIKPSTWDVMKDAKKEPISTHKAFEKLRGFTDKLDGGGTDISERQIKRILNRILMEQPSNVYQTKKEYELGRGSGVDFTLEAENKFKKATQDNADAIVSPPIGEFPDYGGIRSGEGVPFRPEGIITKLIFNCIPQQRSTHRKNEKSKLHLFVHGDEKELIFPVFNNELESELTNVFCKR